MDKGKGLLLQTSLAYDVAKEIIRSQKFRVYITDGPIPFCDFRGCEIKTVLTDTENKIIIPRPFDTAQRLPYVLLALKENETYVRPRLFGATDDYNKELITSKTKVQGAAFPDRTILNKMTIVDEKVPGHKDLKKIEPATIINSFEIPYEKYNSIMGEYLAFLSELGSKQDGIIDDHNTSIREHKEAIREIEKQKERALENLGRELGRNLEKIIS